eukprot:2135771-Rhodomonas_salina.6
MRSAKRAEQCASQVRAEKATVRERAREGDRRTERERAREREEGGKRDILHTSCALDQIR